MTEVKKGPITGEDKMMREYVGFSMMGRPKRVIETASPRRRVYTPDNSDLAFMGLVILIAALTCVVVLR